MGTSQEMSMNLLQILKRNPNKWPAGTPGSKGGEFAPKSAGIGPAGTGMTWTPQGWRHASGKMAGPEEVSRIQKLKIPKGYRDVRLNKDHKAAMQGKATDSKGREKRFYSAEHHGKAAAAKFERIKAFSAALPGIRQSIEAAMHSEGPDKDTALVLHMIDLTGLRPGSDRDRGGKVAAYGATTLEGRHATVKGSTVSLRFVGKNGKPISLSFESPKLAKEIAARGKKPGSRLFDTSDVKLRVFLEANGGKGFLVKDFRTHFATAMALRELKKYPRKPRTVKELNAIKKEVSTKVSSHLGNTPKMAQDKYIDPTAWGTLE